MSRYHNSGMILTCDHGPTCLSLLPYARCSCPTGFEGPTCGVNTDDCVEHACANGGICVDGMGNYTCQCPLQYAGMWASSVCGEVRASVHALNPIPVTVGALPQRRQEVSAGGCLAERWGGEGGQLLSCLSLVLSPGRACEQLVDFCSPDLNPCQHEAQCVGTPDGPR